MYNHYENDFAKFWIDNGILYYVYKPYPIINLDLAKQIVADRLKLQGGIIYPMFCDTRGIINSEQDARDYLATRGSILCTAIAFLVESVYNLEMVNFYIKTSKPCIPAHIFTKRQEALDYLKDFK